MEQKTKKRRMLPDTFGRHLAKETYVNRALAKEPYINSAFLPKKTQQIRIMLREQKDKEEEDCTRLCQERSQRPLCLCVCLYVSRSQSRAVASITTKETYTCTKETYI